ncbi:MAG: phospho-N-acetylmuramoyl-pentapeptide-transferase [Proteobacteria bacterium]|nr:phospho-N-acetylmuramoyl-pentapeptide-transferase [Pseudomonadota bacterium]
MLVEDFSFLNVSRYITFRAGMAFLTSLLLSLLLAPWFIQRLQKKRWGQVIRDDGPGSHQKKNGTPTMGGGLIILAVLLPSLLWMNIQSPFLWALVMIVAGFGLLGFIDDYLKIQEKNAKGLTPRVKLISQFSMALIVLLIFDYSYGQQLSVPSYEHVASSQESVSSILAWLFLPFMKFVAIPLGILGIPFACFVIVGSSNAVNLTDGLDGLAIGPVMIAAATLAVLCYVTGHVEIAKYLNYHHVPGSGELSIFAATMVGAGLGFLWYNTYPAQVFMGDVGSLPLGAALGTLAVLTKHEILWALIGGIFVLETLSVMTQVISFKLTGKRVFKMAPIHHHLELKGWAEPKVIVRFWIIAIILAMIALLSLKVR